MPGARCPGQASTVRLSRRRIDLDVEAGLAPGRLQATARSENRRLPAHLIVGVVGYRGSESALLRTPCVPGTHTNPPISGTKFGRPRFARRQRTTQPNGLGYARQTRMPHAACMHLPMSEHLMNTPEDDAERRLMREQAEQIANDPNEQKLARQILEEWADATASWPYEERRAGKTTRRESLEPIAYSLKQASQIVPFSKEYLAREIRLGRLGAVNFGRRVTIPRENLESWYHDAAFGPIVRGGCHR